MSSAGFWQSAGRTDPVKRTRLFEDDQQQLTIAVFVRSSANTEPARIKYVALDGSTREEKSRSWRPSGPTVTSGVRYVRTFRPRSRPRPSEHGTPIPH